MNLCEERDCLLHPEYKPPERKKPKAQKQDFDEDAWDNMSPGHYISMEADGNMSIQKIDEHNHTHHIGDIKITNHAVQSWDGQWTAISDNVETRLEQMQRESGMIVRIESLDMEIPIECTMCSHCMKLDMKELVLAAKAKKLLEGETA